MPQQVAVTVSATVKPDKLEALRRLLATMSADGAHNPILPFGSLPHVHFGRLLLLDQGVDAPTLLLLVDADDPLEQRLKDLVAVAGDGLDQIFSHCEGYPDGAASSGRRLDYLRARLTGQEVFYVHAIGRSLQQALQEEQLRQAIRAFLDRPDAAYPGRSAIQVREAILAFVKGNPALAWTRSPAAPPGLWFRVGETTHMLGVPLILILLLPLLIPAAALWAAWLRIHEFVDPPPSIKLDPIRLRELGDLEDFVVQNAISTVAPIKPGRFWPLTAWIFLNLGNYLSRHVFVDGSLAGLQTVHFARLMRLDGGRRVLFTSYYDGSLESYMNDFVDQVAWVLNGVFGNQEGYPRTRWLFFAGANDELGFKAFLRGHQVPTQVWYAAYPDLAAVNLDNNAQIRAGLYGEMTEAQAQEWLLRL